jgi:flagellar basal body-associated protein FliL
MTTNTTTLNLSNMKQLIDLNGDKVNFELQFKVESTDGSEFDALVVTQEMLDSGAEINYQKANGTISGNIISDKGEYQSYLLILKSDKPTEVVVSSIMKDIPYNPSQPQPQPQPQPYQPQPQPQPYQPQPQPYQPQPQPYQPVQPSKKKSKINWVNVLLIVIGIVMLGFVGWMFYKYFTKDQQKTIETQPLPIPQQVIVTPPEIDTDSIVKKVSNNLESIVDTKLNSTAENITKNLSNELNQKIDGKMNSLSDGIQSTIHKEMSVLDNSSKITTSINDGFSSLHKSLEGLDKRSEDIATNITSSTNTFLDTSKTLVSEAVTKTLDGNKAPVVDLGSIESQLKDIKSSLDSSQINNPLKQRGGGNKKDGLLKSIESLKIQKE